MKSNALLVMCAIAILAAPVSLQKPATHEKASKRRLLFPVVQNDKIGFIDESGIVVIKPQFGGSMYGGPYFSDGLAPVSTTVHKRKR